MFNVNEKIMQAKGAVIDFKRWRRDQTINKINRLEDKLEKQNESIDSLIEKWLDGWSIVLKNDGYRTRNGQIIDLKTIVMNRE